MLNGKTAWCAVIGTCVVMTGHAEPAAAAATTVEAAAATPDDAAASADLQKAAKMFGARDGVIDVSISPDGTKLAVVQPLSNAGAVLEIAALDGTPALKPILSSSGSPDRLTFCRWSTDTRLICGIYMIDSIYGKKRGYTRLVAIDADGSDLKQLSARGNDRSLGFALGGGDIIDWSGQGEDGSVLMERWYIPETSAGHIIAQQRKGLGVDRVDTRTLRRRTVERPRPSAVFYLTDGLGNVRILAQRPVSGIGVNEGRYDYFYRKKGEEDWLPLTSAHFSGARTRGFEPMAVDPDLDVVYGTDARDGHAGIYKIALDGSLKEELVFDRPDVDVTDLVEIGRQHRVVGVSWVTDKRKTAFFDPELKQLAASLSSALPGAPLVAFVDASLDEQKLVLFAGSDVDPGRFYLFDKGTKKLSEILPVRPQLAHTKLAVVKPVSFPAADGTMIPAYLTLPPGSAGRNLPAIVLPHGGPWARDEWSFDWLSQFFANRGYAVLQPNYRGSTGYGDAWFVENGFKSWRTAVGDVNDGGRWLVKQGIADPDKLAIVGWSYGGYAALQSQVLDPELFNAVVAGAPVTDFDSLRDEWTGDSSEEALDAMFGDSDIAQAGSPARHADRFQAPVLLFHGDLDQNVAIGESRLMKDQLEDAGKSVQLIEFDGLDHYLDDSNVRARLLATADTFLRKAMEH
jgi:dipeptidyl aminopeptidase/acylaminoacyl peptidase